MNPHSRRNRQREGEVHALERIVGDLGVVARCGDLETLHRTARELREREVEVLAVAGGDGTNSVVLTAFSDVYGDAPLPPLAMLRGGTMNTVANGIGVPRRSTARLLRDAVAALAAGRPLDLRERPTLRAGGRVGFLFGMGLLHGFLAEYYRRGRPHPTPVTAVETLAVGSASALVGGRVAQRMAERFPATLVVDGERVEERDYLALAAGTSDQLGLGFRPFHRSLEDPTRFHLIAFTCSPAQVVANLPRFYRAQGLREDRGFERLARRVHVEVPAGRVPYMVDGDLLESDGVLELELGPRVRVVVGA